MSSSKSYVAQDKTTPLASFSFERRDEAGRAYRFVIDMATL
jgi:hypothetical protein